MAPQVRNAVLGMAVAVVGVVGLAAFGMHGLSADSASLTVGLFTWYILSNLRSSRTVRSVPDEERRALLATPPPPGFGLLYVYREGSAGKAVGIDVVVDGRQATQLRGPSFTRLVLPAGQHLLAAGAKGSAGAERRSGARTIRLEEGSVIVVCLASGVVQGEIALMEEADPQLALQRLTAIPMVRGATP